MKYILIVNGYPRSGKDTFIDILGEISDIPLFKSSWVDVIKNIIAPANGWDGRKDEKGRALLAKLADENNDRCFQYIIDKEKIISEVKEEFIYCVCARRPKDIQKLVDYYKDLEDYKVITIFIKRKVVKNKHQSNTADIEVENYKYDVYINNSNNTKYWELAFTKNIEEFYNGTYGAKW